MSKILIDEATVKLALEALKVSVPVILGNFSRHSKAIAALEALAEPDFWEGYVPEPDKRQQALDKKAENARELGLMPYNGGDYEPAQKRPRNCGTGYCSCIECVVEPAPVAWLVEFENGEQELHFEEQSVGEINTPLYTSPPAQKECEKCSRKND